VGVASMKRHQKGLSLRVDGPCELIREPTAGEGEGDRKLSSVMLNARRDGLHWFGDTMQ